MSKNMLRRCVAELIGTFALVFFGCGARDMVGDTTNFAGILLVHITFGLIVAAMIYMFGYLSSAQFNPAVTFGFALAGRFPWRYVLPYWLAQIMGAVLAISCHALFIGDQARAAHYGATIPKIGILPSLGIEFILTFFLMMVSMASATDKRFKRSDSGLTIGFTIIASGLMANSLSGASMNPVRSLAPALFAGGTALSVLWIFIAAPLCGAALGALVYELLRGNKEQAKPVIEDLPAENIFPSQGMQKAS